MHVPSSVLTAAGRVSIHKSHHSSEPPSPNPPDARPNPSTTLPTTCATPSTPDTRANKLLFQDPASPPPAPANREGCQLGKGPFVDCATARQISGQLAHHEPGRPGCEALREGTSAVHPSTMFLPYALDSPRLHPSPAPQGKVAELRLELNSGGKKDKNFSAKKTALKKIVANMTMSNNDMVALFPDIVGCMHIPSLEIKKMCVTL